MDDKGELIRQRIKEMAKRVGPSATLLGVVKSVDAEEGTCVLVDDEATYNDVRLHVVLNGDESQSVVPKVGAYALAIRIEGGEDWYLQAVSEVEAWRLSVGNAEIEQDESGLLIKKGNDTLKDVLNDIIDGVNVIIVAQGTGPNLAKLTSAKTKLENLLR